MQGASQRGDLAGRMVKVQDHYQIDTVEVAVQQRLQTVAAIAEGYPHLGLLHAYRRSLVTQPRSHLRQAIQARYVTRLHGRRGAAGTQPLRRRRLQSTADISHATVRMTTARSLLPDAAGIQRDVGHRCSFGIPMPMPTAIRAEGDALILKSRDALADVFGRAFDGRFGQPHTGPFTQELAGFVEAVADAAGQGCQLLDGSRQAVVANAGLLIEGEKALAATSAVVVGA